MSPSQIRNLGVLDVFNKLFNRSCLLILTDVKETKYKKGESYLPSGNVLVEFGAFSVAPHMGWCVIVYVRIASPSAKFA